jgi:hypothetical protein
MSIRKIILGIGLVASPAAASGCWRLLGERGTGLRLQGTPMAGRPCHNGCSRFPDRQIYAQATPVKRRRI